MNDRLLEYSDILDWWEAERLAAHKATFELQNVLLDRAQKETDNIPDYHLWIESSEEREALETSIFNDIRKLDAKFLLRTIKDTGPDVPSQENDGRISQYSGWSFWDLGKVLVGGGSAGGAVVAGSRAAPAAFAAVGLGVLAAPITIAAGLAGLAWSAYSVSTKKRDEYLNTLTGGISKTLTATDPPEESVLSRQLARIDAIRDIRLERLP